MAGALVLVVFILGVLFSNMMDDRRYEKLQNEVRDNSIQIESRQLQLSYLKSSEVQSCSALQTGLSDIIRSYNDRLGKVQAFQKNSIFKEKQFKDTKHQYTLSGIRYWMYTQELRRKCDYNATTVLFFTENLFGNSDCDDCTGIGAELSIIKKKYEDQFLLFTIPTSLDDGAVNALENQYNITKTPTLIINGEKKLEGFQNKSSIEKAMNYTR